MYHNQLELIIASVSKHILLKFCCYQMPHPLPLFVWHHLWMLPKLLPKKPCTIIVRIEFSPLVEIGVYKGHYWPEETADEGPTRIKAEACCNLCFLIHVTVKTILETGCVQFMFYPNRETILIMPTQIIAARRSTYHHINHQHPRQTQPHSRKFNDNLQ